MLQPPLAPPPWQAAGGGAVTYGALIDQARVRLAECLALRPERLVNPDEAREELLGFLRFVRLGASHIALIGRVIGPEGADLRTFARHLGSVRARDAGTSAWNSAASHLGAAHDLFAAHLGESLEIRTPEAATLFAPPSLLAAARDTTEMLTDAAGGTLRLTQLVATAERGPSGRGVTSKSLMDSATRAERTIQLYGRAVMWGLHTLNRNDATAHISSLTFPAVTPGPPSRGFNSALAALRSLRQLSFDQARGRVAASPTSLRDLAHLGELASDPNADWIPGHLSGPARVQRATLLDSLEAARVHWSIAAEEVSYTVQGLTRAPHRYRDCLRQLREAVPANPVVRLAVVSALPRLADDAAQAVDELASSGSLLTRQRIPMTLRTTWASLSHDERQGLIERFENAGVASATVATTLRQLRDGVQDSPTARLSTAVPSQTRERARGLHR